MRFRNRSSSMTSNTAFRPYAPSNFTPENTPQPQQYYPDPPQPREARGMSELEYTEMVYAATCLNPQHEQERRKLQAVQRAENDDLGVRFAASAPKHVEAVLSARKVNRKNDTKRWSKGMMTMVAVVLLAAVIFVMAFVGGMRCASLFMPPILLEDYVTQ